MVNQNEPPILTGKFISIPVVNCIKVDAGDRFLLDNCKDCSSCQEIQNHFVVCTYVLSKQEQDEKERRKKGVGQTINAPMQTGVSTKAPDVPKNVFVPQRKK